MFKRFSTIILDAYILYKKHHMYAIAGNIAFFALWSLIPFIIIWETTFRLFSFYGESEGNVLVPEVSEIIDGLQLTTYSFTFQDLFAIFVLFYLSSKAFTSLIFAANSVFNNHTHPRTILDRLKGMLFTVIIIVLLLFLFTIPIIGQRVTDFIYEVIPALDGSLDWLKFASWPATFVIIFIVITFVYTFAPTKYNKVRMMIPGALFTSVLWLISSFIYSFYVNNIANYNAIYGLFSSVISLMVWLYILSQILIMGLVINGAYRNNQQK